MGGVEVRREWRILERRILDRQGGAIVLNDGHGNASSRGKAGEINWAQ